MRRKIRLLAAAGLLAFSVFGTAAPAAAHGNIPFTNGDLITCGANGTQVANAFPIVQDTGWVWHRSALWSYQQWGWVAWNDGGTTSYWSHWSYGNGTQNTPAWTDYTTGTTGQAQIFPVPFVNYYDTYITYNEVYFSDGHSTAYWSNWSNWC